jgi:hypothetical protein
MAPVWTPARTAEGFRTLRRPRAKARSNAFISRGYHALETPIGPKSYRRLDVRQDEVIPILSRPRTRRERDAFGQRLQMARTGGGGGGVRSGARAVFPIEGPPLQIAARPTASGARPSARARLQGAALLPPAVRGPGRIVRAPAGPDERRRLRPERDDLLARGRYLDVPAWITRLRGVPPFVRWPSGVSMMSRCSELGSPRLRGASAGGLRRPGRAMSRVRVAGPTLTN